MTLTPIGDLSRGFVLRHRQAGLQSESMRLQTELTTGRVAGTRNHLRGDYAHLSDIERGLSMLESYRSAIAESDTMTATMQAALGAVRDHSADLSAGLMLAAQAGSPLDLRIASADAEQALGALVGQLNSRSAGRALFSGAAYDSAALAAPEEMLAALRGALAGTSTLAGVEAAFDSWFGSGGGFETSGYLGATRDGTPLQLSEDLRLGLSVRADDPAFRDTLKATAMAALAADESLGFAEDVQVQMIESAGAQLIAARPGVLDVIAGLGVVQSRIEDGRARNEAAGLTLELARNTLLSVDPYETATRFEAVQSQIETLYAVTVRAARMSLLDYMR